MITPVLETERLILRPVTLDDAPAIQKYFNDWDIIKDLSMDVPWPYPDDGAEIFIKNHVLSPAGNKSILIWGITQKENNEVMGIIDYRFEEKPTGNRGFWLAKKFWGRGFMSEAVTVTQDYLFFECGLDKFRVMNALGNAASRRVKEKTGAVYLGECDCPHHSGENRSELWEVSREKWTEIRKNKDFIPPLYPHR